MNVLKFEQSKSEEWNQFSSGAKNSLFLFHRSYMDYHKDRFTDHSLMFYNSNNKLLAIFPASEKNDVICSHAGLTFGSLLMPVETRAGDVLDIFDALIQYYKALGFKEIVYKAISYVFHKYPAQEDLYALFHHNATLYRRDISTVVYLPAAIRFSESKRRGIQKCLAAGVEVSENQQFDDYWELLSGVLQKYYDTKPVHSLIEITYLKQHFPGNIRLFEARQNGVLLAGTVIYDYGNCVHTQYLANSDEGRKLDALDFINSKLMAGFKDRQYYSFGICTENEGRLLNKGLIHQKEMMGGRAVCNDFYKISL
jgi:hypothetical protein